MRQFGFLAVLALVLAPSVLAQDPFQGVPIEPRPSEYLLWDGKAAAGFKAELEGSLRAGAGIWGTPFTVANALPRAPYRRHDVQIVHRAGYTQPEIHATKWDIYVVLDGAGTVLIGGERVNWIAGRPPEGQTPQLKGAQEFRVAKGDIMHVPARVWHQVRVEPRQSITYALINVLE
jgi:mannose-6-phosphate isomerase-like protein (cupin superfamily)